MTEQQTKLIKEAVDHCFHSYDVNRLVNPEYFPSLVEAIREHLLTYGANPLPDELALHCIAALCVLGPGGRGAPPEELCQQLMRIVSEHATDHLERTLEFAVAFGCGKWREIESGNQSWPGLWSRAIEVMSLALVHAVREVNVWLGHNVPGYPNPPFWQSKEGREMIGMDARYLALRLINPVRSLHMRHDEALQLHSVEDGAVFRMHRQSDSDEFIPAGARLVFGLLTPAELIKCKDFLVDAQRVLESNTAIAALARDEDTRITFTPPVQRITLKQDEHASIQGPADCERWGCSCGNRNCAQRHRLDGWEPSEQVTLWSFLASAVKGLPKLVVKSFVTGSYYPLLAMEGGATGTRVRLAPIVMNVCRNPDCTNPDRRNRYEGTTCPYCKQSFNPETGIRIMDDLLIAVSDIVIYERQTMLHCRGGVDAQGRRIECDNLYSCADVKCPACRLAPKLRRPTTVWVRTFDMQPTLYSDPAAIDRFSTGEDPSLLLEDEEAALDFGYPEDVEIDAGRQPQADHNQAGLCDD